MDRLKKLTVKMATFSNKKLILLLLSIAIIFIFDFVVANPEGGSVAAGDATITSPDSNTVQINQSSDKAIINWQTFNIQQGEKTIFVQPGSQSIALNRINGNNGPSSIFGQLSANGQVWLINPAGIVFGPTAHIDVGGLLASTSNIKDEDFLAGRYHFFKDPNFNHAAIVNEGHINITQGGLAALIGTGVKNDGVINANTGKVILAGAEAYTLDFDGDQLINFKINQGPSGKATDAQGRVLNDAVDNSGKIITRGGSVLLATADAKAVVDHAINMKGVIIANSASMNQKGEIILSGGNGKVNVQGKLIAKGGNISVKGDDVLINNAKILASSKNLLGGTIQVQANQNLSVDQSRIAANSQTQAGKIGLYGQTVKLSQSQVQANGNLGGGEILIGGDAHGVGSIQNAAYTLIDPNTTIEANAIQNGNGGKVVVWADNATGFYGNISAKGGAQGGNGGWVETSGKNYLNFNGQVDTSAPLGAYGTLLLDPRDILISNLGGLPYDPGPGGNNLFVDSPSDTSVITATSISAQTSNVILQANNDITIADLINIGNLGTSLTLQAGRNIAVNADVTTNNAAISMTANDSNAQAANRGTGTGNITLADNITLKTGMGTDTNAGAITLTIDPSTNAPFSPGTITVGASNKLIGGTITIPSSLSLSAGTLTVDTSAGDSRFSGVVTGTGGLTKEGIGSLILTNDNHYSGENIANNGVLIGGTNFTAFGSGNVTVNDNGTVLLNNISPTNTLTLNGGTLSGLGSGSTIWNGAITLTKNSTIKTEIAGSNLSIPNTITESGGSYGLTIKGPGTVQITPPDIVAGNNYTGGTIVEEGTLLGGVSNHALGSGDITVQTGGELLLAGISPENTLHLNGGELAGAFSTAGWQGNIILDNDSFIGTDSASTSRLNVTGTISGTHNITTIGNGIFTLAGNNASYSGAITVSAGSTLSANSNNALGTTDVGTTVASGGTLNLNNLTISEPLTLSGSGVGGIGALTSSGNSIVNSDINLNADATIGVPNLAADTLTLNGLINASTRALTLLGQGSSPAGNIIFNNMLTAGSLSSQTGAYAINILGGSNITNASTFSNTGTVTFAGNNNLFSDGFTHTTGLTTLNAADIKTNSGVVTVGAVSLTGSSTIDTTNAGASAGGDINLNSTVDGAHDLSLTAGAGTISLTGPIGGTAALTNFVANSNVGIALPAIRLATGGNLTVNSDGQVTQTGVIDVPNLTVNSIGGTILNLNNIISNFNATNTTSGNINLTNIAPLTITGISQAGGGNIEVNNTGTLNTSGAISTTGNGNVTLNSSDTQTIGNTVTAGGSGNVNLSTTSASSDIILNANTGSTSGTVSATAGRNIQLNAGNISTSSNVNLTSGNTATTGTISEAGSGKINANSLTTISKGGTTLNAANTITNFTATNSNGGNIELSNTANTLTTNTITQSGSGGVSLSNMGALIAAGNIHTQGGSVNLTTSSPDSNERVLTINGQIVTEGGAIAATAANNAAGTATALIVNNTLDTTGGSGTGTLILGGGVELNSNPILGGGNILLQGNGLDLVLGNVIFNTPTMITVNRFLTITGTVTSGAGDDLTFSGDINNTGTGGVLVKSGAAINSGGNLTIKGSNLTGLADATPNAAVELQSNATLQAAGDISLAGNTGNGDILLNGTVNPATNSTFTINPTGTGNIIFNNILNGAFNLVLNTQGNINFNNSVGNITPLAQVLINNANNVTSQVNIYTQQFTQSTGSGTSRFAGNGLNSTGNINIKTNYITGGIYAPHSNLSLNGINGMNANITAANLLVNGLNGGTLFGTVTGFAARAFGAVGNFTLNGRPIGIVIPSSVLIEMQGILPNNIELSDWWNKIVHPLEDIKNQLTIIFQQAKKKQMQVSH